MSIYLSKYSEFLLVNNNNNNKTQELKRVR